jgi:GH25 family lysozyme M1 (1,4-beta-N-acetylmuramidase)
MEILPMVNPIVIDISHHQADPIDWAAVKRGGTVGVFHKATEGTTYVDDKLFTRMKAAKAAGLLTSTYHFMRESNMPGQMDHYLSTIDPIPGERVVLDHECSGTTLAELEESVRYIRSVRPDLQISVYSGHQIKEQLGTKRSAILADNTTLWVAQYGQTISWPTATWPQWTLWQFTDEASCDGINGPVDANRFNGSQEQLVTWLSPVGSAPAPEPIEPEAIMLTVPKGQRLFVNGIEVLIG